MFCRYYLHQGADYATTSVCLYAGLGVKVNYRPKGGPYSRTSVGGVLISLSQAVDDEPVGG